MTVPTPQLVWRLRYLARSALPALKVRLHGSRTWRGLVGVARRLSRNLAEPRRNQPGELALNGWDYADSSAAVRVIVMSYFTPSLNSMDRPPS